ncbi:MAG: Na+/H+ antiporter subunit E [Acholeplasmataceae bacterium]|nr:Na+/H+ antiporter subunit E [Acholeplasmataceae bacterium]
MTYIKKRYKLFLFMLAFWLLLNFNLKIDTLLFGVVFSLVVTILAYPVLFNEQGFRYHGIKLHKMLIYFFVLFIEIFKSAFTYIINLISRKYEPVLFKIDLDLDDPVLVGIVANSITLTPGTISVEIEDHSIYVLTLAKPGTPQEELERPIRNKFERFFKVKEKKHD